MANQQLTSYIREHLGKGYDLSQIRSYLIKYGYNPEEVDSAIKSVYGAETVHHHVHHVSKNTVIAFAIICVILAFLVPSIYFLLNQGSTTSSTRLLDVRTSLLTMTSKPGDKVEFNIELSNLGTSKRYDVSIKHEILGTNIFREETIAVETTTSKTTSIQLPNDIQPGKYTLKTTVTYQDKVAVASFTFFVSEPTKEGVCSEQWQCDDWVPAECPVSGSQTRKCFDTNSCGTIKYKPETSRSCTPEVEDTTQTQQNTGTQTIWDTLDRVKELAKTSPSNAADICKDINIETHRDECYLTIAQATSSLSYCEKIKGERSLDQCYSDVAKQTMQSSICEKVVKTYKRDSCYMHFFNNKDYTVCDKIETPQLKEVCIGMRDLPDYSGYVGNIETQ
jgi:hypothetical protein